MSARPAVSVVMPFAGDRQAALAAIEALGRLHAGPGDELLLADNAGALGAGARGPIVVVAATGERSPAHARNAGAAAARPDTDWILFLDADTIAPADLVDRYFDEPIDDDIGAVAGAIRPAGYRGGLAARYATHKNFLDAGAHLSHPFMPRAAAANLLVRRAAFDWVGGFFEGLRAAEDTDFSWRLQQAGWRLIGRPQAIVEHRYRDSVTQLRRQWRSYAAGRAWLGRRYEGFRPRPALGRAAGRALGRARDNDPKPNGIPQPERLPVRDRVAFAAIDGMLGVEELIGLAQANRPPAQPLAPPAAGVLVAARFPEPQTSVDPGVRVEAARRSDRAEPPPPGVAVRYREDEGRAERAGALLRLALATPGPTLGAFARDPAATLELAPAALRLRATPNVAVAAADPSAEAELERLRLLAGSMGRR
jgi:Glycosyl transferase family group 2